MKRFAKYRVKVGNRWCGKVWRAQVRVLFIWFTLYQSEYKSDAEQFIEDHAIGTRAFNRRGQRV